MVAVTLTCAILDTGTVLDVEIDDEKKVTRLKTAIKDTSEGKITVPSVDLRLFLAKKDTTPTGWLNWAGLATVALDGGRLPKDFEEMNPTLAVKNPALFGEDFKPGQDETHVLVVLPIDRAAKRQKIEHDASLGDWGEVAVEVTEVAKELSLPDLEEGNMLTVPRAVFGTAFPDGLYVRREYWELYRIIQNALKSSKTRRRVLVLGSPGVGKSAFGVFLLLLFMTKKKDVVFCPLLEREFYYFTWSDVNGYEISVTPRAGTSYEALIDGNEREGVFRPHFLHTYLFASPRTKNYNEFAKRNCFQVIMNPWTKAECQSLVELIGIGNQDEWYHKFNLIGGIPRLVFPTSPGNTFDDLARRVEAAVPRSVDELKREIDLFQRSEFNYGTKHIVYHMRRDEHWPSLFYPTYASLAVETLFSARLNIRAAVEIQKVLQILAPSCQKSRGNEMDNLLLQSLVSSKFCMKALEEGSAEDIKDFGVHIDRHRIALTSRICIF